MDTDIINLAESALAQLRQTNLDPYVDTSLPLPRPYQGTDDIRLVIIGQDPTVQREKSRQRIHTVLNLNQKQGLWRYLKMLCESLGLSLEQHVYATNAGNNPQCL